MFHAVSIVVNNAPTLFLSSRLESSIPQMCISWGMYTSPYHRGRMVSQAKVDQSQASQAKPKSTKSHRRTDRTGRTDGRTTKDFRLFKSVTALTNYNIEYLYMTHPFVISTDVTTSLNSLCSLRRSQRNKRKFRPVFFFPCRLHTHRQAFHVTNRKIQPLCRQTQRCFVCYGSVLRRIPAGNRVSAAQWVARASYMLPVPHSLCSVSWSRMLILTDTY